jgi:hypothetical protein
MHQPNRAEYSFCCFFSPLKMPFVSHNVSTEATKFLHREREREREILTCKHETIVINCTTERTCHALSHSTLKLLPCFFALFPCHLPCFGHLTQYPQYSDIDGMSFLTSQIDYISIHKVHKTIIIGACAFYRKLLI